MASACRALIDCRDPRSGALNGITPTARDAGRHGWRRARGDAVATLSVHERVQILRLHKQGLPVDQIAKEMSRSWWTVKAALRPTVATKERLYAPSPARLSMADREEIRVAIARGRRSAPSPGGSDVRCQTASQEVAKNGGRDDCRAYRAHQYAALSARRPKASELASRPTLRTTVEAWLEELWSPEQIAHRLRLEHPADPICG